MVAPSQQRHDNVLSQVRSSAPQSEPLIQSQVPGSAGFMRLKVRIEEKLFLVPVPLRLVYNTLLPKQLHRIIKVTLIVAQLMKNMKINMCILTVRKSSCIYKVNTY